MSIQIGLGLIGNFIYFWCLFKNRKIRNPDTSAPPSNNAKFIEFNKSPDTNVNKNLSSRQENSVGSLARPKRNIYLYIKTLAISDFLFCVNSIALPVIYIACYNTCRKSYFFTLYIIRIGFPLMDGFTNFSYILRVFISLDRLWALQFPFSYRTLMSNSFIRYLIIIGFIVCSLAAIPYSWGYILATVKENESSPILYNPLITQSITHGGIDPNLNNKYKSVNNNLIPYLNESHVIIKYTHSLNPKTPWFQAYRKWITFIMSFIPLTISAIANFFIIKKCYKISHNRTNLKHGNKPLVNKKPNILLKWFNKMVSSLNTIPNTNGIRKIEMKNTLPIMQRRELQITILMSALNMHYIFSTIPMILYIFIYQPWTDTFSTKSELWFQNIVYLSKYGNNALSVYITLFFDPTIKTIFYIILKKYCCLY
ncbi:unnamed protein product [Gordionus sp. m RMFG-2023]